MVAVERKPGTARWPLMPNCPQHADVVQPIESITRINKEKAPVWVFFMFLPKLVDCMDTSFDALWHKVLGLSCTLPWLPLPTYGGQFLQRYAVMSLLLPLAEILDICAGQRVGRPWWLCNKPSTPRGDIAEMIGNGPLSGPKVVYFF